MIRHIPLLLALAACNAPPPVSAPDTGPDSGPTEPGAEVCLADAGRAFETPCALSAADPGFIAQVQRALAARDLYDGEVSGTYDGPTRAAVRLFQAATGPDSGTLSTASAKLLGLVAVGREGV